MFNHKHAAPSANGVPANAATAEPSARKEYVMQHHTTHAAANVDNLLWDGLPPVVVDALAQPLDPALVSRRRGRAGRAYDYIEGHTVIDQANRIFGFGGWGYELIGEPALRRIESVNPKTGEVKASLAYSAPVRVSVVGAQPRADIGFHAVAEDTPEGHDTAIKGAVTDGMKRALRSFGGRFGNGLYGGDPQPAASRPQRRSAQAAGATPPSGERTDADDLRRRLVELSAAQGFDEAQARAAVRARTGEDLDVLSAVELAPLVESAEAKLGQRRQAQAA